MIFIYALIDPTNQQVFYVGVTRNPKSREAGHLHDKTCNKNKIDKVKEILSKGLNPEFLILDTCDVKNVRLMEDFYIDLFKSYGFKMLQGIKSNYSEKIQLPHPNFVRDEIGVIKLVGNFMGMSYDDVAYYDSKDPGSAGRAYMKLRDKYYKRIDFILLCTNSNFIRDGIGLRHKPHTAI